MKAKGSEFGKEAYIGAAGVADQNAQFAAISTAIKQSQADRQLYQSLGETKADIAGAGLARSGSALDILRESASQEAMTRQCSASRG